MFKRIFLLLTFSLLFVFPIISQNYNIENQSFGSENLLAFNNFVSSIEESVIHPVLNSDNKQLAMIVLKAEYLVKEETDAEIFARCTEWVWIGYLPYLVWTCEPDEPSTEQ